MTHLPQEVTALHASAAAAAGLDLSSLRFSGRVRHYGPDATLFSDGDAATTLFQVAQGWVRVFRVTADGRRHINRFVGPGEIVSLATLGRCHASAEAIGEVEAILVPNSAFQRVLSQDPNLAALAWRALSEELDASEQQQLRVCRLTAEERVAAFLCAIMGRGGASSRAVYPIPMSRRDIADHLGVTLETVSRELNRFDRIGLIGLEGVHKFRVRQPGALSRLARGDRDGALSRTP
jgi:CRP/FNR family transcriptional regulator